MSTQLGTFSCLSNHEHVCEESSCFDIVDAGLSFKVMHEVDEKWTYEEIMESGFRRRSILSLIFLSIYLSIFW